jgi:hypothetical protein
LVLTPTDFELRRDALEAMIRGLKHADSASQRIMYRTAAQTVVDMDECIKQAKFMGDPSDPRVAEWYSRHRPGAKSTVSYKPQTNPEGYPRLPALPRGHFTGRTASSDAEIASAIKDGGVFVHRPAHRRASTQIALPDSVH